MACAGMFICENVYNSTLYNSQLGGISTKLALITCNIYPCWILVPRQRLTQHRYQ